MMRLVLFLESPQDRDRVFDRRLGHQHRLEPPFEGRVFLDVLAVLVERRRANTVQFTAGQRRLEQVARVHRPLGRPRTHHRVQLVDEQNHLPARLFHLFEHRLEPVFELAPELRPCDQRPHVERDDRFVFEVLRHVTQNDPVRDPFDDRRLPDARLANQHRVVLPPPRQNLNDAANLRIAPDHRVDLPLPGRCDKVVPILL